MIRKDVKLGFAIGGVLLAVLVVYVLVGSENKRPTNGASIADGTDVASNTDAGKTVDSGTVKPTPIDVIADKTKEPAKPADASKPSDDSSKTPVVADADKPAKPDANGELWDATLNKGELANQPVLMSSTPSPADASVKGDKKDSAPADASKEPTKDVKSLSTSGNDSPLIPIPRKTDSSSDKPADKTSDNSTPMPTPSGVGPASGTDTASPSNLRTHTVQKGETLAKISLAAYGSANYYPHILRANPGLDPNKLKVGQTINLPASDEVVAKAPTTPATPEKATPAAVKPAIAEAPIDPKSQYRVESGDSLYRISMKLYGTGQMVDKIYELNKDAIGGDRARLKLNQVLKLPEAPTETAAH